MRTVNRREVIGRFSIGGLAIACSIYFAIAVGSSNLPVLLASVFIFYICITDTLLTKIPNLANISLIAVGVIYNLYVAGFSGFSSSVLGLLTGLLLFVVPYLMGGMGAGDVKALAALGALMGPANILHVFLYIALIGGALSLLHYALADGLMRRCRDGFCALRMFLFTRECSVLIPAHNGECLRFPYAAAIGFGFYAFVQWGALI